MKLKIFAIDDDRSIIEQLSSLINDWAVDRAVNIELIAKNDLNEVVPEEALYYDLIILDVLIGDENGIEFAKTLRSLGSYATIAFISNYSQYAINGYSAHAVSYLLKPLNKDVIYSLLDDSLFNTVSTLNNNIHVSQNGKDIFISPDSVIYIESFRNQVTIHMTDREESFNISISNIEKQLINTSLMRCHRSYIINLKHVREISHYDIFLYGINQPIPLSRSLVDDVKSRLLWKERYQK